MSEVNWRIGHLDYLESPWGNAGGVVKTPEETEKMSQTGVGWIEAGSYTLNKRYGSKKDKSGNLIIDPETGEPVIDYFHNPVTGETFNALDMPNPGEEIVREIPEMVRIAEAYGKKLIANVAPVSDDPINETVELVTRIYEAGAHGVLVNPSCPNIIVSGEERKEVISENIRLTYLVFSGLRKVTDKYPKVFIRPSPQKSYDIAKILYRNIESAGTVSALWVPNTWGGHRPMKNGKPALTIEGNIGGRSGPATSSDVEKQLLWARQILNGSGIQFVASGAIANSEALDIKAASQLKRFMDLGAVAGAGTTFYYESKLGWKEDTDGLLYEFYHLNEKQAA